MNDQTRFDPMSYETEIAAYAEGLRGAEMAAMGAAVKANALQADAADDAEADMHREAERIARRAVAGLALVHRGVEEAFERAVRDGKIPPGLRDRYVAAIGGGK